MREAIVDTVLSEEFAGYRVTCYDNGKYMYSMPFRDKEDAEDYADAYVKEFDDFED